MKKFILPEEKLNELAQQSSERWIDGHYFNQGVVNGEELKQFTEYPQVNRFLLFQVFQIWNMQLSKLKHPYFDFSAKEIQDTLKILRNQLSQHITIDEKEFKPMLRRAVANNIKLLTDPYEAFTTFFFANKDEISLELFEKHAPFFSDFDFIVNSILRYHQKNNLPLVKKEIFFDKMDKVINLYNSKSNSNIESYRDELFQKLVNRRLSEVMEEAYYEENLKQQKQQEEKAQQEEEERIKQEEELLVKQEEAKKKEEEETKKASLFDTLAPANDIVFDIDESLDLDTPTDPAPIPVSPPPVVEEPVVQVEPQAQTPLTPAPEPQTEPISMESTPPPTPIVEVAQEEISVNGHYEAPVESTVQDMYQHPTAETPPPVQEQLFPQEKEETVLDELEVEKPKTILDSLSTNPLNGDGTHQKQEESKETTASFLDRFLNSKQDAPAPTPEPTPVAETLPPVVEEVTPAPQPAPVAMGPEMDMGTDAKPRTIGEQFSQQQNPQSNIHESLNGNGSRKIKLNEIPIHKQYQYVQKVFEGNNVRFRIIVDKINNAVDKLEVEEILKKFVLNNDTVDQNDGVVKEFLTLLRNRF
ncbi:MAG: hypothetical protein AAF655_22490 [Bacteroidota bacterium]